MNKTITGYRELNDRAYFYLRGPDTLRFLNGQISQDVNLATDNKAVYTCISNAKGKLQGVGFIRKFQEGYLLDCPIELKEALFDRLDMYLIADDVTLSDITEEVTLYHILGSEETAVGQWLCNRVGIEGIDTTDMPSTSELPKEAFEQLRIHYQIPAWGHELDDNTLPPEVKLEARAISYTKGCYTGQEVISRMKSSGKVNRILTNFQLSEKVETPFQIPNPTDPDAKSAGIITSISQSLSDNTKWTGLGFLNKKFMNSTNFTINTLDITVL